MAVALQDRKRNSRDLQSWLDDVAAYERAFKSWEGRVEKILRRYRDDPRTGKQTWTEAHFNILWSNVQTLSAATFSRLPKPDVSRRYRDQDPVGRVAAMILERGLEYHVQHYPEYRSSMKGCVLDRFLGARGTNWVRYEPHFRAAKAGLPTDGDQITEDVDEPNEELDYECVAVDYVHWKDFGHSVARTWEEVNRVWRRVYMTKDQIVERFGKDVAKLVPLDADPRQQTMDKSYAAQNQNECATVYEGWDKSTRKAVWFSKSVKDFLDEKDDPLGLEDVFPCPPPLFGTITNDSLIPVPDFTLYQDQQNELDLLADRIDGLVKALKVCGGYDASIPELQRIFTESDNGTLVPIKNWAAFAEKNGLVGALSLVDLTPIANALKAAYEAFEQIKNQVYEITGISDIIRGNTKATETATAQQIKGQYASLRLKAYQDEVAIFATGTLSLMGQIICRKFSPETIAKISGAAQFPEQDQQYIQQALTLLIGEQRMADPDADEGPNPVREFRISIAADSMVYLDEQAEQESRVAFLQATGSYIEQVAAAMQQTPPQMAAVLLPLLMDMLKFGVTGYRVGKSIEGAFDEAADKLKQIAQQPPQQPQVPPEVQIEQMKQQGEEQRSQRETQRQGLKDQADVQVAREKLAGEQQLQREKMQGDWALDDAKHMREMHHKAQEAADNTVSTVKDAFSQHEQKVTKSISDSEHRQQLGAVKQDSALREHAAKQDGSNREAAAKQEGAAREADAKSEAANEAKKELKQMGDAIQKLIEQLGKPKKIVRGKDGRAEGVETVQ